MLPEEAEALGDREAAVWLMTNSQEHLLAAPRDPPPVCRQCVLDFLQLAHTVRSARPQQTVQAGTLSTPTPLCRFDGLLTLLPSIEA
jgi:hypothetical protein